MLCCVACLNQTEQLVESNNLSKLLEELMSIKLPYIFDSHIPPNFCPECSEKLNCFKLYKENCLNSVSTLEKIVWEGKLDRNEELVCKAELTEETYENVQVLDDFEKIKIPPKKPPRKKATKTQNVYCSLCSEDVPEYPNHVLEVHSTSLGADKFQCKLCENITCHSKFSMRSHFYNQHRRFLVPEKCPHCSETFLDFGHLKKHLMRHKEGAGKFKCHHCGVQYAKKQRLLYHLITVHSASSICKYCMKIFTDTAEYREHMKVEVAKRTNENHVCDICGFFTRHRRYLVDHITRLHTEQTAACDECGKICKSSQNLKDHKLNRHREKLVECKLCDKRWRNNSYLREHMKMCHPTETVACTLCGKQVNPSMMKRHNYLAHSVVRPFSCSVCNMAFKMKAGLKKHLHTHSGTRPFNCGKCTQGYYTRELLLKHYVLAHGITYTAEEFREMVKRTPSTLE